MFKELIDKLKLKKKQLQNCNMEVVEKTDFEITISKKNNIFKIEISDYISIINYVDKMKSDNQFYLLDLISNGILWNSQKQKINKGIYYVISVDNRLYNILINDEMVKIDERIKIEIDEQTNKNDITEEKIITVNTNNNEFRYCSLKHDKTGSTFYTKYYSKNGVFGLDNFDLSEKETYDEISSIVYNLESIDGIENIIDIKLLRKYILDELGKDSLHRTKTL